MSDYKTKKFKVESDEKVIKTLENDSCSVWVEDGVYWAAPTIDANKFGPHDYQRSTKGTGFCKCGCIMARFSSYGSVDPFGPCPENPL